MKKNVLVFVAVVLSLLGYYLIDFFQFDGKVELEAVIEESIPIKVYITGEVVHPGVYELPADARIEDLLEKAGGPSSEANLTTINLAMRLDDGDKVVIPAIVSASVHDPRDLNTMTEADFMLIDTIGEVTARRIVAYREAKGYLVLEDLLEVEGIGPQKLEVIQNYLEN